MHELPAKASELRKNPRYRLIPPPEIEILQNKNPAKVTARLGDLSRGGCYLETNYEAPIESELTVILRKGREQLTARARVVRAYPQQGMGLEFREIEGNGFHVLDDWLSTYIASTWVAASRRRTQRVAMQIPVRVSGYDSSGARFAEDTFTVEINSSGGSVILQQPVRLGQRLVLWNLRTNSAVECMVAHRGGMGTRTQVGLAFVVATRSFWPIAFPPADWTSRDDQAKRSKKS
jgi:hypothetical protein